MDLFSILFFLRLALILKERKWISLDPEIILGVVMKFVLIFAALVAATACTTVSSSKESLSSENQKAVIEATETLKK